MEFDGVTYPDVKLSCNRENMTKLVEALESGEYEQARSQLLVLGPNGKKAFCCLGVACDVSGVGQWEGDVYITSGSGRGTASRSWPPEQTRRHIGRYALWLPETVQRWLGIEGQEDSDMLSLGGRAEGHGRLTGVMMNDRGATFTAIAAAIREVYLSDEESRTAELSAQP